MTLKIQTMPIPPPVSQPSLVIVMAAGKQTRWGNAYGTSKHLIPIDGEPLLRRTLRLLRQNLSVPIWVIIPDDPRYYTIADTISRCQTYIIQNPLDYDAHKFMSSIQLWHNKNHPLFVYGDCFFTEVAVATICQPTDNWLLYARPHASTITGGGCGECFAYSVPRQYLSLFQTKAEWITGLQALGRYPRSGGWELYRAMTDQTLSPTVPATTENMWVIDDLTEDFDYPSDYAIWAERYQESLV